MKINLNKRGFSILKEDLNKEDIVELKKELTVKPFINGDYGVKPKSFPTFCESIKKLYIPRFYGQKKYGIPSESKLNEPKSINIEFSKSLKDKQKPIVDAYLKAAEEVGGGGRAVPCGKV